MLYEVSGSFQKNGKQHKAILLLYSEEENEIREFMKLYGVAVFNLKPFEGNQQEFGNIEFEAVGGDKQMRGIAPYDKLKDAFSFLNDVGFQLVYINNLLKPLEEEQVKKVLNKLHKDFGVASKEEGGGVGKKKTEEKQYDDKKVKDFKNLISSTIEEAEQLTENVKGEVSPVRLKELKETIDEMVKVKMGTNIDRMIHLFQEILFLMEKIELEYVNAMKKKKVGGVKDTVLGELDVLLEYDKYKRSEKVFRGSSVGDIQKNFDDYYYKLFGKTGVYIKLLLKELQIRLTRFNQNIAFVVDLLEFFFLVLILELIAFYLYNLLIGENLYSVYYYLWNIGIIGLLFYFFRAFRKKSNFMFLIITFLFVGVFFLIIRKFIIANFGF